jgi:mRNA interferase RelE/StbE
MYTITITESALKELKRLQKIYVKKIQVAIDGLANNPRPAGYKKLKGEQDELYRIRIGDYRVIYSIENQIKIVDVRRIGHRKDIYK